MSELLPMFPLGNVLVPHMPLPLHVFEDRYRRLVRDCLDGDHRFGVVLIDRGSDVGGGDHRTDLGTAARIVEAREAADGRWAILAVGTERLRVRTWAQDDPYPQAEVESVADGPWTAAADEALAAAERVVRRSLALLSELDEPAPPMNIVLSDEPQVRAWQLVAISPSGPLDRHGLLGVDEPATRLRRLARLAEDECTVLAQRLAGG